MPTTLEVPSAKEAKEAQRRKLMATPSPDITAGGGDTPALPDNASDATANSRP